MAKSRKPLHHHLQDYFFPHPRNNHRPHIFSATSVAVLIFAVLLFEGAYLVQTKIVFLETDFLASVLPGALAALTNQDRAINGLAGVTEDALLDNAAQAAAEDMASKGYFAHVSPDGKQPWYWLDQAGYRYTYAGENLAVNFTDSANVETAWMASPTHRANIVKPQYTQVGFGTANGTYEGRETTFVVEFFAAPPTPSGVGAPTASVGAAAPAEGAPAPSPAVSVLGSQTQTSPASPGWLSSLFLLASPLHTLTTMFTVLFAIIAVLFTIAILVRGKSQHPTVLIGGTLLLLVISGAMLMSTNLAGPVQLNPQAASVQAALP
jgi:hypothetical protein